MDPKIIDAINAVTAARALLETTNETYLAASRAESDARSRANRAYSDFQDAQQALLASVCPTK